MKPVRLQLSRKKGFNLQEHSHSVNGLPAVNVARPSRWGNPYLVNEHGRKRAVWLFEQDIHGRTIHTGPCQTNLNVDGIKRELAGKNLACWCGPDDECHADILLKVANE